MRVQICFFFLLAMCNLSFQTNYIGAFLKYLKESKEQVANEPLNRRNVDSNYDFVIIGAGSAGCVLANRLTENRKWKVLLLEAGGSETILQDVPIFANQLQLSEADWNYKTFYSTKYCLGMNNNQCFFPRGKVLGGSSVLNFMIYSRGNKRDYDNWSALGNTGWSFKEVLPYFKKIENFKIPEYRYDSYHNRTGYLNVEYPPHRTPLANAVIKANKEFGIKYVDYNGKTQTGTSYVQASTKNGRRHSSNLAYLYPIKKRSNFHLKKNAMVTKILINPKTKKAYGVKFIADRRTQTVYVNKEVILSAGAISSPQILMLSGVGPEKHLKLFNIPVLRDSYVGYNLMDHVAVGGMTFTINQDLGITRDKVLDWRNCADYWLSHKGVDTVPGGCEALTFYDTSNPTSRDGYPDVELLYIAGSIASDTSLRTAFNLKDSLYNTLYRPIENKHSFMIFPMAMRPKSKGRILLKNKIPNTHPIIIPNYFADQSDLDTLVRGVRLTLNITNQPAMKKIGAKFYNKPIPECIKNRVRFGSDKYFECMARHLTLTVYHYSGTCKMGPVSDKRAVVDPRLKVHGIRNLRVIDASIIPEIPAAHTNAPVYMIAEKGADMIKEDWD